MAKKEKTTRFSIQGFDLAHYKTTEQYVAMIDALFNRATQAITNAAARGKYDPSKPFSFDDHPTVKAEMQKAVGQLASRLTTTIEKGSRNQWLFACKKNDGFINSIMDTSKLKKSTLKKMQDRNLDALEAFQQRKIGGMNLAERVWKYMNQYKTQIEDAIDMGLGDGRSAQALARDVKQYLREPDKRFRRVKIGTDADGNPIYRLSKRAAAYHPGQGVYRSSVKNAQRLTRSEINMAYRESDYLRWQQLDFVVGFEIHRSNHEPLCKCKLCERLKGRYPKTFKFKGWHPQCMCFAVPILMDEETFREDRVDELRSALRGTEYKKHQAKNAVVDVPDEFKAWVKENLDAAENWGNVPYFVKDNFVDGSLKKGLKIDLPGEDPVQAQLDALMPQVEAARIKAKEWRFDDEWIALDDAVKTKDIAGIKRAINAITQMAASHQSGLIKFIKDANALIKELTDAGGGRFTQDIASLNQYIANLKASKHYWSNGGAEYYESEIERLRWKLEQYKSSPEAQLTPAQKKTVADARAVITKAEDWDIDTSKMRNLVNQYIDNPDVDLELEIEDEYWVLDKKIAKVEKACTKFVSDSQDLIREAKSVGVDIAHITPLERQIFDLSGGSKGLYWSKFKKDAKQAFNDLKAKIEEAKAEQEKAKATKSEAFLNPQFTGVPHPALKTSYSADSEVDLTFTKINGEFANEKWFEHGDLRLTPTNEKGVNGFTYMDGRISLKPDRLMRCKSALAKIAQGKTDDITFEEADAMATFWHEIMHNRNVPGSSKIKSKTETRYMELANEFISRHSLPEFYAKLGTSRIPHPEFIMNRASTGYNAMVTNYDYVIDALRLNRNKVIISVRDFLFNGDYANQEQGLKQGLLDGGLTYANGKPVKKSDLNALLKLIREQEHFYAYDSAGNFGISSRKEDIILEWLKKKGFIK